MPLTPAEAAFIDTHKLGCRYGQTIDGAAYAFLDIVGTGRDEGQATPMQRFLWTMNPNMRSTSRVGTIGCGTAAARSSA